MLSRLLPDAVTAEAEVEAVLDSLPVATPLGGGGPVFAPGTRRAVRAVLRAGGMAAWRMLELSSGRWRTLSLPGAVEAPEPLGLFRPRLEGAVGSGRVPTRYPQPDSVPEVSRWAWLGVGRASPARLPGCGALPIAYIPLRLPGLEDAALGRALSFPDADRSALFEAFERTSSVWQGQCDVRRASPAALLRGGDAVDPAALLQYHPEDVARSPAAVVPYDAARPVDWVRGFSARRDGPVWVPARHAFLGYEADAPYVYETSSGVAVGACAEEAMLHALLEVVERDAFLMTWYARLTPRRVRLSSFRSRAVQLLLDHLAGLGWAASVYDVTQESGVPSVWVQVRRGGAGPRSLSGAGAHLSLERAVLSALVEVVGSVGMLGPRAQAARAASCWADPDQVTDPDGHFQRFAGAQGARALSFLEAGPVVDASVVEADAARRYGDRDLTVNLRAVLRALLLHHPDVVFVDLTTTLLRRHGLRCVRALVPGALPMTFGHRLRRVHGCDRLERHLGRHWTPGALEPHPFP